MQLFLVLMGQIFLIAVVHSILEVFVQADDNRFMGRIISIACYLGSLYLLLNFISEHVLSGLNSVINLNF